MRVLRQSVHFQARLVGPAVLVGVALLLGCERQSEEEAVTPSAPPADTSVDQPVEPGASRGSAGDIAREIEAEAREAAAEAQRAAEEALEQAQREAAQLAEQAQREATERAEQAQREAEARAEEARREAEAQAEEVSQAARATMESYLGDLGSLTQTLSGVTNQFNAASAAPGVRTLVGRLESSMEQLEQLAPEQLTQLKAMYAEQLEPLIGRAQAEINRLASSDSFAALRPMLQDMPLLRP